MSWIDTDGGYQLGIVDGAIKANNSAGKQLKSVPAKVKKTEQFTRLEQKLSFLRTHEREVVGTVELWLQRGLPVSFDTLRAVWADEAWAQTLRNLLIGNNSGQQGLVHNVDEQGVHIIDLDGEPALLTDATFFIPHPVLIDDLDEWREFIAELNLNQSLDQLFREVHRLPPRSDIQGLTSLDAYANAYFSNGAAAKALADRAGAVMRGGYASVSTFEDGQAIIAQYWIGSGLVDIETYTNELMWVDDTGQAIAVDAVLPVAYSEGVRLARLIYAGRDHGKEN